MKSLTLTLSIFVLIIAVLLGCEKIQPERITKLSTDTITNIDYTSCTLSGSIIDLGSEGISQYGFCWSTNQPPTIDDTLVNLGTISATGPFNAHITGLKDNTTYYVRAYALNSLGEHYGNQLPIKTLSYKKPQILTASPDSVTTSTAIVGGDVTDDGGNEVLERGVFYSASADPETSGTKLVIGNGTGEFSSRLTGLAEGTKYFVKAFATNSQGISYGSEENFATEITIVAPTVTTATPSDITTSSATVGGNVTDEGGDWVSEGGVYYGTSADPESTGTKLELTSGAGEYSTSLSSLFEGTKYYVKAYATNSKGTSYGSEESFTTDITILLPTVTTSAPTDISDNSATVGGNVTDDGGVAVDERGVYYGTASNPETAGTKLVIDNGTGVFSSSLTGLIEETTYYVKAFATNSEGTSYGDEENFETDVSPVGTVTDYDGNLYQTVQIGDQIWMAENLKVTHYPNGTTIPQVTVNTAWAALEDNSTDDAYCYYNNESTSEYGALYTYAAAMNVCPTAWHLPSDAEWSVMENYLADNGYNFDSSTGGNRDKIGKAVASDSGWGTSSTIGAVGNSDFSEKRNASGFSALPGGFRVNNGLYANAEYYSFFWCSEYNSTHAYMRSLFYNSANVTKESFLKSYGMSVRCIKD